MMLELVVVVVVEVGAEELEKKRRKMLVDVVEEMEMKWKKTVGVVELGKTMMKRKLVVRVADGLENWTLATRKELEWLRGLQRCSAEPILWRLFSEVSATSALPVARNPSRCQALQPPQPLAEQLLEILHDLPPQCLNLPHDPTQLLNLTQLSNLT
jgi:hypothetical protein